MTYTIGIGALIEGDAFNCIRRIELDTANAIGNFQGLVQPPHVTVKRPFDVKDIALIKKTSQLMHAIASNTTSFELTLGGVNNFADKVWYLSVQKNEALAELHNQCLDKLMPFFPDCKGVFEGENAVFHSTITMDMTPEQFALAEKYLKSQPEDRYVISAPVTKLGLFLGMNNNTHWVIVDQTDFRVNYCAA